MKKRGFTLVEILVVLAILGILAAILFPAFSRARSDARTASCSSNLRQIGLAMRQYSQDNSGFYPDPDRYGFGAACSWPDRIFGYVRSPEVFECPETEGLTYKPGCIPDEEIDGNTVAFDGSYDMSDLRNPPNSPTINVTEARFNSPSKTIVVLDGTGKVVSPGATPGAQDILTAGIPLRHNDGANALYADGHVEWRDLNGLAEPKQWNILNR